MSLVDLEIPAANARLPDDVRALLREADRRIELFVRRRLDPIPGFVPSDYTAVYIALLGVAESSIAPGRSFCEWGSGLGIVVSLAAMLGFDACGIEIEQDLVDAASQMAEDFNLPAQFAQGSFIPEGGDEVADTVSDFAWLATGCTAAHDELGLDTDDFDLIFAYPWPGEEQVISQLFDRYAAVGALLLTYHGSVEDIRLRRKTGAEMPLSCHD